MGVTVHTRYVGNLHTEAEHLQSGNKITTDAPVDNGGKGEYFSPTDMLAAALGSCSLTIMGKAAQVHGFNIDGTEVEISKIMGTDPRRVVEIVVEITFPSDYEPKVKKILELAAHECPVANSLHPDLKQTFIFHYGK
ncbi:MAG TPA: OsmC family protein [Candidatus Rikenella faecigallinarum]|uniref:OsmC family protein n=1 Tax=Candidatus Rikenella faecigallinarum TaxID=2838745 RepID=A0A9D1QD71_9BACT|nr:OsmC family protein [Candidatus Rikenella faecigallinarum]